MVRLFNKILEKGEIPEEWVKSEVILFYEKGNVLANTVSKIFTSILARRLSRWSEDTGVLPEVAGFREKCSCEDNIFILSTNIPQAMSTPGGRLYTAFVDYRRAFDSVSHAILWQELFKTGISVRLIQVLQDYYKRQK